MAKTVFGVPGIGDKSRETAGDAVAPGGTPGAQSKLELPQKGGKEPASSADNKAVSQPSQGAAGPQPDAPASPKPAKPASGPAMAKPKAPPMAKPAPAAKSPGPGGKGGGKTVFGMPALKLPEQPEDAGRTGTSPTEPAEAPWKEKHDAVDPEAAAEAKDGDAYKATVLGMAAMDLSDVPEDSAAEPSFSEIEKQPSASEADLEKISTRPPEKPVSPVGVGTAGRGSARFPQNISSAKSNRGLIIAIIVLFIVLVALVLYFFGSSSESAVSSTPPSSLSHAASGEAAQSASDPGAVQ